MKYRLPLTSITLALVIVAVILYEKGTIGVGQSITPQSTGVIHSRVLRVIDGDTVDVDINGAKTRLRLIGMNSPETVAPSVSVQCYGPEASARAHLMLDDQFVDVEYDSTQGQLDRYGRTLAYIWLPNHVNFALTMIRAGFAREYTYSKRYLYSAQFKNAEAQARTERLGLWGICQ